MRIFVSDSFEYLDQKIEELKGTCEKELREQGFDEYEKPDVSILYNLQLRITHDTQLLFVLFLNKAFEFPLKHICTCAMKELIARSCAVGQEVT